MMPNLQHGGIEQIARTDQWRAAVAIATKGRPTAIPKVLEYLARQTVLPYRVILSATNESDLGEKSSAAFPVTCIYGPPGLTAQRNRALNALSGDADIVIFFDDDFAPCRDWIERCVRVFNNNPLVVGVTGQILADGSKGNPITWDNAQCIVNDAEETADVPDSVTPCLALYGCNMACRMRAAAGLRFDERLVLYGWLEDKDFSYRLLDRGPIVQCAQMTGVHLGMVSGRVSGKKFGYSQVVNLGYLRRKGVLSRRDAARNIVKALVMNTLKSITPEPHLDRRGRLLGNLLGLIAIVFGSCDPEQAARL